MYRVCDICGGVDEHPRHTFAGVIEGVHPVNEGLRSTVVANIEALYDAESMNFDEASRIISDFDDTTSTERHIDCCADAGCPLAGTLDGCDIRAERADGGTGEDMLAAVMAIREENLDHFETPES